MVTLFLHFSQSALRKKSADAADWLAKHTKPPDSHLPKLIGTIRRKCVPILREMAALRDYLQVKELTERYAPTSRRLDLSSLLIHGNPANLPPG